MGSPASFLICLATFVVLFGFATNVGNYLTLETKRDSAPFFVRNGEELIKDALKIGIGLVLGYLFERFRK
jgi:hypothetical protein